MLTAIILSLKYLDLHIFQVNSWIKKYIIHNIQKQSQEIDQILICINGEAGAPQQQQGQQPEAHRDA